MQAIQTLRLKYWPLIKSLQTALLLCTGLAGYFSARCPVLTPLTVFAAGGSLFLAISGSTVLNMWYDRDLDARMRRTMHRPLSSGLVRPGEALGLGLALAGLGVGWALALDLRFGAIVFAGLFFDVVVYTIWLKRRTHWSIVWGGISGGMPILAGRALGIGGLDWIAALLALGVLFWIPTHIMTFSMRYDEDYRRAGIPTFPQVYGFAATRAIITLSSILAALSISIAAVGLELTAGALHFLALLSGGLLLLAVYCLMRPSEKANFGLFKFASLYMLSAMLVLALSAF
jgi:protoheme IX farnesyltransferase